MLRSHQSVQLPDSAAVEHVTSVIKGKSQVEDRVRIKPYLYVCDPEANLTRCIPATFMILKVEITEYAPVRLNEDIIECHRVKISRLRLISVHIVQHFVGHT